jgi:transforming growth factor-beta-induced protein
MRKYFALSLFVLFAMLIAACSPASTPEVVSEPANPAEEQIAEESMPEDEMEAAADQEMAKTIVDIAVEDGRFTTLVTALTEAGLVDALLAEGPFTVFAPTDEAFAALPEGALEELLADKDALTNVLLYHVVDGKVMAADVVGLDGQEVSTLSGDPIMVAADDMGVMINESKVVITDIEASNGVIHVVDAVILPSAGDEMAKEDEKKDDHMAAESKSIVDIAVEDGRFNTLVTAVTEAGLAETLQSEGPFTVFAPTDDAFAALPEGTVEALLADIPALTDILLYHVVEGKVMAADVAELDQAMTVQGQYLDIANDMGKVMVDNAQVMITDIEASNGVIHVIDAVILPESRTIADIAVEDGRFNTLVAALTEAELVETLQSEGPFTVFAPTDEAFAALPEGTVEALLADIPALTDILLYHVIEGKVMASDVVELDQAETVQGQYIDIASDMGKVMVDNAEIIITDIETSNGVIHVIDTVILPESRTIADIAVEDGRFNTLVTALTEAGLVETLQGEGPFTVFAPTDDAFASLPAGALDALVADIDALTVTLLDHVVDGKVMAAEVVELDGKEVETLAGSSALIKIDDGVYVGDALVIITDIEASNGVIHVIDSVLLFQ